MNLLSNKNVKTGVLLVNLGTPDSPTTSALRKYHHQFFSDPRVIDTSWLGRQLLKYLIILPFRSPKTAKLYKEIWTDNGSPLLAYAISLQKHLQQSLGVIYQVEIGMGYGNPSIQNSLRKLKDQNINQLIVLPLFPQYASATTGSVTEAVMKEIKSWEIIPELKFINSFYNDPGFIKSWVERGKQYNLQEYDHIIFSYHGLPERQILKADKNNCCLKGNCCAVITDQNYYCYRAQCFSSTRSIADGLGLNEANYSIGFQSRFGKTPWLQPYLDELIIDLARKGNKKILVFPPSFVADCIETIHEIGTEYAEVFVEHGGEKLDFTESLNDHPAWINALKNLIVKQQ